MGWIVATLRLNWANLTANKGVFATMALLMALQNLLYFLLWVAFFARISSLKGWGLQEVTFLYAAGAIGFGIFFSVLGGCDQLSRTIQTGQLDLCLTRPRSVLLSALLLRMRADSLGDIVGGFVMLALFGPSLTQLPLILALSVSMGMIYVAARLTIHSLAFWGLDDESPEKGFIAFLIAATNPQNGFSPWAKVVLLSVIPAGYIALLPVEILHHFSWSFLAWQFSASTTLLALAVLVFHLGLRRYESGNTSIGLR